MSETSASNSGADLPRPPAPPEPPVPPAPPRVKVTDPERMKALSHPARMAVFDFLGARRVQGRDGATATEIAEVAGMTPSAMSYHLRTLAKAGFIEEAPNRGDARERVWRLRMHSFQIEADKDAPESDKVAEVAMVQAFADQQDRNFDRWVRTRADASDPRIRELATVSSGRLRLTPEQAKAFMERFFALYEEYVALSQEWLDKGDPEDGTVVMNHLFRYFPDS